MYKPRVTHVSDTASHVLTSRSFSRGSSPKIPALSLSALRSIARFFTMMRLAPR